MEEALKDERFSHILTDPRFRSMPKHVKKITVDRRFKGMFKDKKFNNKCLLDKRGRPLDLKPSENLKNLYQVSLESSDEDSDENEKLKNIENTESSIQSDVVNSKSPVSLNDKEKIKDDLKEDSKKESSSDEESSEDEPSEVDSDDSDSSDSDNSEEDQDDEFDHQWDEQRNEAPDTDTITHRLAVCNMDWDRIRAEDLFVCFNSFKPADGKINSVKIYPSEFGLKRMEEERLNGPPELVKEKLPLEEESSEDKHASKYHREKLRQYQMNRLKYYYAIVDCDSAETADTLCKQLNGMEYESSANLFDLRFVPDDMTFEHDPVSAVDKMPDTTEYKPRLYVTTALQQVKVDLTWDETDPTRKEVFEKAFTEPDNIEKDIAEYLASSSEESEDETTENPSEGIEKISTKERIAKYKELLQSLEEKEENEKNKYEMEISWDPGLKEKTEEMLKDKLKKEPLTPFEEKLQKSKEEKKLKRKEKKIAEENMNSEASDDSFEDSDEEAVIRKGKQTKDLNSKNLASLALMSDSKKIVTEEKSKKRKKSKEQKMNDFKCDVNDPRFSAIYTSHLFNIDPSDPHFKKTDGNMALVQEKQRKLQSNMPRDNSKNKKFKYS